jgi:methionyl aminopeptidase
MPPVHNKYDIQRLRKAARLAADTLQKGLECVKAGVTTEDLDKIIHDFIISKGGYPAPIYYMTFPKSVCTSVNESEH